MGQACSVESRPPELQEVISFRPTGPLPATSYRSNLKIWRFFATSPEIVGVSLGSMVRRRAGGVATERLALCALLDQWQRRALHRHCPKQAQWPGPTLVHA